ncbi:inositol monophosphatase family protein [Rhizobium sp. LCM 4573]|uniref:inositol monophosphatase family protein n=1 Tax=Rhizobium sp. LCM 4573 TaxID=1848291 RepID=UPI0008D9CE6C|nr:inositol monophosphatase family protein [Rhizobium sp. LCM 4573]OHV80167.1 inositol monophosphatase [Rhizobium sp. LCM 4573]
MDFLIDKSALRARAETAVAVARRIGRDVARFRNQALPATLEVENKGLQDFVTVADRRSEQAIRSALLSAFPEDAFMGEEGGGRPGDVGTWVVDPIDGTTNFIRGFRHWGVSIAFVLDGEIQVGVIYDAAQDSVFHAIRGGGAFKEGAPIAAAKTTDPTQAIAILGHSRRTEFEDYLAVSHRLYERGIDYRRMGAAAIGLVRVAEGIADLYYERHLSVWDMLAGVLIAREAGAKVAVPPLAEILGGGGPVVAYAPQLEAEFAFLMEVASLSAEAG